MLLVSKLNFYCKSSVNIDCNNINNYVQNKKSLQDLKCNAFFYFSFFIVRIKAALTQAAFLLPKFQTPLKTLQNKAETTFRPRNGYPCGLISKGLLLVALIALFFNSSCHFKRCIIPLFYTLLL